MKNHQNTRIISTRKRITVKGVYYEKIAAKVFLISAGFLFLGACGNTKKSAESTVQEVQDTLPVVVQQLNDIQALENSLQSDWEADIQEDYTMTTYAKKTGKVFTNIQERQQLLKSMQKSLKVLSDDATRLSNLKDKNLPSAEIQIVDQIFNRLLII